MKEVIYVGSRLDQCSEALTPVQGGGFFVTWMPDAEKTVSYLKNALPEDLPALVIFDTAGMTAAQLREAAMNVLRVSAGILVSAVTAMPHKEFHDAMEGLGMLAPMPENPGWSDGEKLLEDLQAVYRD